MLCREKYNTLGAQDEHKARLSHNPGRLTKRQTISVPFQCESSVSLKFRYKVRYRWCQTYPVSLSSVHIHEIFDAVWRLYLVKTSGTLCTCCTGYIRGRGTFQILDYKNLFPLDYVLIVDLEGWIFFW